MESFKFIVRPEMTSCSDFEAPDESHPYNFINAQRYMQLDLTTLMQYICLTELLNNGFKSEYKIVDDIFTIGNISVKDIDKIKDNDIKDFITHCIQTFGLRVGCKHSKTHYIRVPECYDTSDDDPSEVFRSMFNMTHVPVLFLFSDKVNKCSIEDYLKTYPINKYTALHIPIERHVSLNDVRMAHNGNIDVHEVKCCQESATSDNYSIKNILVSSLKYSNKTANAKLSFIESLIEDFNMHRINTCGRIHNTMSNNIVYTSDPEITKHIIRNNQKIIDKIKKQMFFVNNDYIDINRENLCDELGIISSDKEIQLLKDCISKWQKVVKDSVKDEHYYNKIKEEIDSLYDNKCK